MEDAGPARTRRPSRQAHPMRPCPPHAIISPNAPPLLWTQPPVRSLRPEADRPALRDRVRLAFALALAIAVVRHPAAALAQTASEVQVTPETMTLGAGQRQPIFAAAYDRQGNLIATAKFTFWSSDTAIARVSREGVVLGVAPGLAKVEARVQGKRASLAVLITGGAAGPNGGTRAGTV